MRKIICFVFITCFVNNAFTQSYELIKSAEGELVEFQNIVTKGQLWGYMVINKTGDVNKETEKYTYQVLDKNYNKITNGDLFENKLIKETSKIKFFTKIKNDTLNISSFRYNDYYANNFRASHRFLSLKDNKLSVAYIIDQDDSIKIERTRADTEKYAYSAEYRAKKEGKVIESGLYFNKEKTETLNALGFYKKEYNAKTGKQEALRHSAFADMKSKIDINEDGKVNDKGFMKVQHFEYTKNKNIIIIAEAYRARSGGDIYTELISFQLDEELKPKEIKLYDAGRTRGYKYGYTQDLPNEKGFVTVFIDKDNDSKWVLNTLAYTNQTDKLFLDKIELEKKGSNIEFGPAKNGFIGLKEYFKNPKEGQKYAEYRLEKINFE